MKLFWIANIMEIINGKVTNEWKFNFISRELAEEQLKNAKEAGLYGYTHCIRIDDEILNFKLLDYGKRA